MQGISTKNLIEDLQKIGFFKLRNNVVRDAINEMTIRYGVYSKKDAIKILNEKIRGKLSDTVKEVRDDLHL